MEHNWTARSFKKQQQQKTNFIFTQKKETHKGNRPSLVRCHIEFNMEENKVVKDRLIDFSMAHTVYILD